MLRNSLDRTYEEQLIVIITISYIIAEINADLENFAETSLTPENPIKLKFYFGFFSMNSFHKVNLQEKKLHNAKIHKDLIHSFLFFSKKFSHKCLVQFCFNDVSVPRDGETPVCPIPSEIRKIDGEYWVCSRGIYLWT